MRNKLTVAYTAIVSFSMFDYDLVKTHKTTRSHCATYTEYIMHTNVVHVA